MTLRREQRELLLNALREAFPEHGDMKELAPVAFGQSLDQISTAGDLHQITLRVIDWASARGLVDPLVQSALRLRPHAVQLGAYEAIYLQQVFSRSERQRLIDTVRSAGFIEAVLQASFRQSWPARGATPPSGATGEDLATRLIHELSDVPALSDGRIPLIQFAARLHRAAQDSPSAFALRKWLDAVHAQRGGNTDTVLQDLSQEPAAHGAALYLLLRVEAAPEGRCTVLAWLSQGEQGAMTSIHADDTPRGLSSVGTLLNELLERISVNLEEADNRLVIEVMLPQELLCHAVDHWELVRGRHTVRCGAEFPVVVRSSERAYDPATVRQVRPKWVQKWKALQAPLLTENSQEIVWEPDPGEVSALFDRLMKASAVCLALLRPHDGSAERNAELADCIDAGMPVALWRRASPGGSEPPLDEVRQLLADLHGLPEGVRAHREAARTAGADHLGHSLVLFWDNPNRRPPDAYRTQRLTLPSP